MWKQWVLFAAALGVSGCDKQNPPAGNNKVNITAPGVNVDVDKDKGKVEVNVPGANIKVNPN